MSMSLHRAALLAACLAFAACGTTPDTAGAGDSAASDVASSDASVDDGSGVDTALPDDAAASTGDAAGPACPGGPGCACAAPDDCDNSLCIETPAGERCALPCVETCPEGFACTAVTTAGGDATTICTARWARLCDPCTSSKSCPALALSKSACVDHGASGAFCGVACATDNDCPDAFSCAEVSTVEGTAASMCVPTPDPGQPSGALGACTCSPAAQQAKLSTPCAEKTEAGLCAGVRACSSAGLGPCVANPPSKEVCDGADNDCDGETDEGSCDDNNPCTTEACAGVDGCAVNKLDAQPCDADGDACTVGDACAKGLCIPGAPKSCDDGNPCTKDACDAKSGCAQLPDDNAPCTDDNPCTLGDSCADGACVPGLPKACTSGQACVAAACNLATGKCAFTNAPTGKDCDDGDACTKADGCDGGVCLGSKVTCDDNNGCTDDSCKAAVGCVHTPNTAPCSDGDPCTLGDTCKGAACQSGGAKPCDDSNPCTVDACDLKTGSCVADGAPLAGKACDADGSVCTVGDACKAGQCAAGPAKVCDDGKPCTDDTCDAKAGCQTSNNNAACDDGDLCTKGDSCKDGGCVAGKPLVCDDQKPCTVDACDAKTGACAFAGGPLDGKACDADGSACTASDACKAGQCTAGAALDCDDSNGCTTDTCDKAKGCVHTPNTSGCEDGDLCTVGDACKGGKCVAGAKKTCDDSNVCTADSCDIQTGSCVNAGGPLAGKPCDADGSQCTENDSCKAGKCVAGPAKQCDDGNVCTTDGCDANKGCTSVSAGAVLCNADNTPCTVDDRCNDGVCKPGKVKPCDDQNPCTGAVCWPSTGKCNFPPLADGTSCGANGAVCKAGKCQAGCVPKVKQLCHKGNVVWFDACDKPGDIAQACQGNEFCSDAACAPGKFNASWLVTANPDTQPLGLLGNAKFPPTLYTFTVAQDGSAVAATTFGGQKYLYKGKLTGKTFEGNGGYSDTSSGLTISHQIKLLWTFAAASPATGKPLPDVFTGLIYDTLDIPFLGKQTLIWKVSGVRQ